MARTYRLVHRSEYSYSDQVTSSYGRTHVTPRHDQGQQCLDSALDIEPAPQEAREHLDFFGNRSTYFTVSTPHDRLTVTASSTVAVAHERPGRADLPEVGWEVVRDRLADRSDLSEDLLAARPYLLPSPMIDRGREVADFARTVITAGRPIGAVIEALLARIHTDFSYVSGSTTVRTTSAEVLAGREGVCQDFAHLAVGALRSVGLAARYVSGYVETRPPPGKQRLAGADASHAWASVFCPELGWVDFDPTNNQLVDDRYVVVAIGRDYGDVPPLRGVIFTESTESTMRVAVDMIPVQAGSVPACAPSPAPSVPPSSPSRTPPA